MNAYIAVSVVNFHAKWGDKACNLKRMTEYIETIARIGSNVIVFPEMALTGYEYLEEEQMQKKLAEPMTGNAINTIAKEARKNGVYVIFGMPELGENGKIYNSAAVCGPNGFLGAYRKIHLPMNESLWATPGKTPFVFQTPWGPMGISICYDTYIFPEIMRYYKTKGVRLLINNTAAFFEGRQKIHMNSLMCNAATNNIYIASANLCGKEKSLEFYGRSNIVGPVRPNGEAQILAGKAFDETGIVSECVETAEFDMSTLPYHTYSHLFDRNEKVGTPDWRPELYIRMCDDLLQEKKWMLAMQNRRS